MNGSYWGRNMGDGMTKTEREPHERVTLHLPTRLVARIDEQARVLVRSRSGMASWLMQKQLGMVGDADTPDDTGDDKGVAL